jgi:hypothetical protein
MAQTRRAANKGGRGHGEPVRLRQPTGRRRGHGSRSAGTVAGWGRARSAACRSGLRCGRERLSPRTARKKRGTHLAPERRSPAQSHSRANAAATKSRGPAASARSQAEPARSMAGRQHRPRAAADCCSSSPRPATDFVTSSAISAGNTSPWDRRIPIGYSGYRALSNHNAMMHELIPEMRNSRSAFRDGEKKEFAPVIHSRWRIGGPSPAPRLR